MGEWGVVSLTLGQALRLRGMTAEALAERASIPKHQLRLYLTNEIKRPDLGVLARLCAVLGCGIDELLHYAPPSRSAPRRPEVPAPTLYTTGQLAKLLSVHPNTIRWYENTGLIAPARRSGNNYRRFTGRHLVQLQVCRIIFESTYTNRAIRGTAFAILARLKEWDIPRGMAQAKQYKQLIEKEYASALETAALLKTWTQHQKPPGGEAHTRREAAAQLGITTEVLRNWERNGLLAVTRTGRKNEKVYADTDMLRLRIIYMLRANNYSLAAIRHSLALHDQGNGMGAALALNQPVYDPDSVYLNAGDHWLEVLTELSRSADRIIGIIQGIVT